MGKPSRDKGVRGEREFVKACHELGIPAFREWQNGPGKAGDVRACFWWDYGVPTGKRVLDDDFKVNFIAAENGSRVEVKRRANGFRQLYKWIEGVDAVAVRSDNNEWLIVRRLKDL